MITNKSSTFRATLKQELPAWLQEGIVTEEAAQRLFARYELANLQKESSGRLAAVIFTLGGLLLGGGVLSFVAANWEAVPTLAKVVLLIVTLLAFHGAGYWLWHYKGWSRLGHALVFTGSLVFGANIGLMAQIFHISGDWYNGFGAWALGSLVLAYAARSWITGLLALMSSTIWMLGVSHEHYQSWMMSLPLLLAAVFLPLAWQLGARVLYAATFVGATIVYCGLTAESFKNILIALVLANFVTWTIGEWHRVKNLRPEFGTPLAALGMLTLGVISYVGSFQEWWRSGLSDAPVPPLLVYWPVGFIALAGLVAFALLRQTDNSSPVRRVLVLGVTLASGLLVTCALVGIAQRGSAGWLTLGVNVAALLLATVAIAVGVLDERRMAFWVGTVFVVLLIISRFLEYETSLLVKSAAFMLCGLVMITAGVAYEKFVARKEVQA